MIIKLDHKSIKQTTASPDKPALFINKIVFVTNDQNWVHRLFSSSLTIKFASINEHKTEENISIENLVFGAYITPYHRQPVLEVNKLFAFKLNSNNGSNEWQTTIALNNLVLEQNESIEIVANYHSITTIEEIITEIEERKKILNDLNLSTQALLNLIPHFRLDWSQNDNEFSEEFNIGVTKPILLSGLSHQSHKIKTNNLLFENSKLATLLVNTFIVEKRITINILKEIHTQIIKYGGEFRTQNVVIGDGNEVLNPVFSDVSEIESDLESLITWYNKEIYSSNIHPLFISAIFHYNLIKIHPFLDGNGRLARVITSLILLSYNIPPPISEEENRVEYINSLRHADIGNIKPLIIFIGNRILHSMNYALTSKHSSNGE